MAVVAGGLVRAQGHHAARLLEDHAGADDPVDDADRARVDDHTGPLFGDMGGLLVAAVGQVDRDQGGVQIAQLIQEGGGPLAVTLLDLISLPVALLDVHMDLGAPLLDHLLDLQQQLRTDEVRPLGAKEDPDPSPGLTMPLVIELDVPLEALLPHLVIELIQFSRLIHPALGRPDGLGDVAPGPHLLDEGAHAVHPGLVVPQGGGARPDGLQDGDPAARVLLLCGDGVVEGLEAEHHPVVGVLGQAPHDVAGGVHMSVDEAGQDHVVGQVDDLLGRVLLQDMLLCAHLQDLAAVDGHGGSGTVADALPLHGIEMGGFNDLVYLFHRYLLSISHAAVIRPLLHNGRCPPSSG